jgi:nitrous oxide reductase
MNTIKMDEVIDHNRRRFFGTAAMTIAAAQLGMISAADAQSSKATTPDVPATKSGTHTSFGPLKQIDAGLLNVGYAEAAPQMALR